MSFTKSLTLAAALFALPLVAVAQSAPYVGKTAYSEISPEAQVARIGAGGGVNIIGGYEPWWTDGASKFTPQDIARTKAAGFTLIRVPLFAFQHLRKDGTLDPAYVKKIDTIVALAEANGLDIILDEHDFEFCAKNVDGCATSLANVWYELSTHFKDAPNSVMFELLNEPNGNVDDAIWNGWVPDLVAIVRETNPTRNIVIGPTMWNSIDKLATLKLPADDKHIIATFHYYSPFPFTHQGASWAGADIQKLRDIRWKGDKAEVDAIAADFDKVVAWSKANNRPVLLGEYGSYGQFNPNMEDRAKWTAAVSKAAEVRGFARAYWYFEDGNGFGVWDAEKKQWRKPLLDALIAKGQ